MQIEKTLINNHLGVSNVSWKFSIPTICNFELKGFAHEICYFLKKYPTFLTVSIVSSVYKQNFTAP